MIALNRIPFGMSAFIIIIKYKEEEESSILDTLSKNSKRYVIKSKNFKDDQVELIAEARLPKDNNLSKEFSKQSGIIDFSLLAYSSNILDN